MRAVCIGALVLAARASACASAPAGARLLRVSELPVRPTYNREWIRDDRSAAAVAMSVIERELHVARLDVTLHFLPDRDAFRRALLANGYDEAFAQQTSSRMDAVSGYRRVYLNQSALAPLRGAGRAAFLAHELTHSLQYELGGGHRGTSEQWIREGLADWVASRVLVATGAITDGAFHRERVSRFRSRESATRVGLGEMGTFPQWVALATPEDAPALAAKMFLAVDFLVARHGMDRVLDYFRRFERSANRSVNFSDAFGETLDGFERALNTHLDRLR